MNRLEFKKLLIEEGSKRGIYITDCNIFDMGEYLNFIPTIRNNTKEEWVYKYQVEELIHDLAPLERPHQIKTINLDDTRYKIFKINDKVEINDLWIRLDAGEKEPDIIDVSLVCGQWKCGWATGAVFETPKQNDRALGVKFERDIWLLERNDWIGHLETLERLIQSGKMKKVEKGQPVWIGTHSWNIRKV